MYDLQRRTTIKDNQTKQISLLEANGVAIEKELVTRSFGHLTYQFYEEQQKVPVNVVFK